MKRLYVPGLVGLLVLVVLVHSPALHAPLTGEDLLQRRMLDPSSPLRRGPLDLYDFVDDGNRRALVDGGDLPWWTDPGFTVRFLRPLPSALVWVDHALFGDGTLGPHLHSLAWLILAVVGAAALFGESLPPRRALLATSLFALSAAHTVSVAWLANRNVLVTTALGACALAHHVRRRDRWSPRDAAASLGLWTLTALTGEYAVGFAGYVLAFEGARRERRPADRAIGLAAVGLPLAAYLIGRWWAGYTVRAPGIYLDPFSRPSEFAAHAPRALAAMLGAIWCGLDDQRLTAASSRALAVAGGEALSVIVVAAWLARRRAREDGAGTLALALGSLLAVAPALLVRDPSARLLGVASLGAAAGVAMVVDAAAEELLAARAARTVSASAVGLGVLTVALAANLLVRAPLAAFRFTAALARGEGQLVERLDWMSGYARGADSTVAVLRALEPPLVINARLLLRERAPARWRVLTEARGPLVVKRTDRRAMEILTRSREPLIDADDPWSRGPMRAGETVELDAMRVTVVAVDGRGAPRHLRVTSSANLDDPAWAWFVENRAEVAAIRPPAAGTTVEFPL